MAYSPELKYQTKLKKYQVASKFPVGFVTFDGISSGPDTSCSG